MSQYTFLELTDLIDCLPIYDEKIAVFEELIKQPYDLYRPIMDMLFNGTIVIEDLLPAGKSTSASDALSDNYNAEAKRSISAWDISIEAIGNRCRDIISSKSSSMAFVGRDNTALLANEDGSPSTVFVQTVENVVGPDANAIAPNSIETSRSGSEAAAQKLIQQNFRAAVQPDIA